MSDYGNMNHSIGMLDHLTLKKVVLLPNNFGSTCLSEMARNDNLASKFGFCVEKNKHFTYFLQMLKNFLKKKIEDDQNKVLETLLSRHLA